MIDKSKFIESKWFKLEQARVIWTVKGEGARVTISIDEIHTLNIFKDDIYKNNEGGYNFRLKLTKVDGTPRTYQVYDSMAQTRADITVDKLLEIFTKNNFIECPDDNSALKNIDNIFE